MKTKKQIEVYTLIVLKNKKYIKHLNVSAEPIASGSAYYENVENAYNALLKEINWHIDNRKKHKDILSTEIKPLNQFDGYADKIYCEFDGCSFGISCPKWVDEELVISPTHRDLDFGINL